MSIQEYRPIANIGFYLLVAGALMAMAAYTWQFRRMPGSKPQACIQGCKGIWLVSMVLIGLSEGLGDKVFWMQLMQAACILSPYFWFVFVIEISHQQEKIPAMLRHIMTGVVLCLAVGLLSNLWSGFFWQGACLAGQTLQVFQQTGLWLMFLASYILCLLAMGFSVRWVWLTAGLRRRQAIWFTMTGVISTLGTLLDNIPGLDNVAPLPLSFLIAGLCVTWGFYRWRVYDVLTLSQEVVVRDMIDGLIVVDSYGYIADMNPAARTLLRRVPDSLIGSRFERLASAWPELSAICESDAVQNTEAQWEGPEGRRCYQLHMSPLIVRAQWLGRAVVFKDITEQKQQQAKLLEQQKALSILKERERLGRELHDGQAQICNFLGLGLGTASSLLRDGQAGKAEEQIDRLREAVKDMNTNIRESILSLKKANTLSGDFESRLREYLAWYEKNRGITTQLQIPPGLIDRAFGDTARLQLLRIIQEALANIRKHAQARQAKVSIEETEVQITVRIEDDGCGFAMAAAAAKDKSFGLQIMAERAKEAGGQLEIDTQPGRGTRVLVRFPQNHRKGRVEKS